MLPRWTVIPRSLTLRRALCSAIFASIAAAFMGDQVIAQPSEPQTPRKSVRSQPTALTPQEKEAQKHYRIALVALENNDLSTAQQELKAAADLAPGRALIWYNLAVVESKKSDPVSALNDLQKAENLGLPKSQQTDADHLEAKLTYEARKNTQKEEFVEKLNEFRTEFSKAATGRCDNGNGQNGKGWLNESYSYAASPVTGSQNNSRMIGFIIDGTQYNMQATNVPPIRNEFRKGTAIADLADLSPDYSIQQRPSFCNDGTFVYLLSITTKNGAVIHFFGKTEVRSGYPDNANTTTTPWIDSNGIVFMFPSRESAQAAGSRMSELIRMSPDIQ